LIARTSPLPGGLFSSFQTVDTVALITTDDHHLKTPDWLSIDSPAVEHELFLLGYRNLTVHVVGHVGLSLLVAAGTWFAAPHALVLGWLAWMLSLALVFIYGIRAFQHRVRQPGIRSEDMRSWRKTSLN